jgi:ferredoxin
VGAGPASTCRVRVLGHGEIAAAPGDRLLDTLESAGVAIEAACGGFAACSTCRVRVIEGALSPVAEAEEPFLDAPGQRLSCQATIVADVTVVLEAG